MWGCPYPYPACSPYPAQGAGIGYAFLVVFPCRHFGRRWRVMVLE